MTTSEVRFRPARPFGQKAAEPNEVISIPAGVWGKILDLAYESGYRTSHATVSGNLHKDFLKCLAFCSNSLKTKQSYPPMTAIAGLHEFFQDSTRQQFIESLLKLFQNSPHGVEIESSPGEFEKKRALPGQGINPQPGSYGSSGALRGQYQVALQPSNATGMEDLVLVSEDTWNQCLKLAKSGGFTCQGDLISRKETNWLRDALEKRLKTETFPAHVRTEINRVLDLTRQGQAFQVKRKLNRAI